MSEPEIYCPHCKWRPEAEARWSCVPSCGTVWNTFWTGGVCPGCGHRWLKTQCLACHEVSLHKDWYHFPEGDDAGGEETRELDDLAAAVDEGARIGTRSCGDRGQYLLDVVVDAIEVDVDAPSNGGLVVEST